MTQAINQPVTPTQTGLRPRLKTPSFLLEVIRTIVFVVAVTVLFDMTIPRSLVDGRSMQPTFQDGDRLIVSRVSYLFDVPRRGDVVVFNSLESPGVMLIKRVLGLPGETLEFRDDLLYINGQPIDEPYILEDCRNCDVGILQLGPDEYFVMGDNRNHSHDSRAFGPVPIDHIVGTVMFRYWPLNGIGQAGHYDYAP